MLEFRESMKSLLMVYKQKFDYIEPVENKENSAETSATAKKKLDLTKVLPGRVTKVLSSMPSLKVRIYFIESALKNLGEFQFLTLT